jgi:hypothetical protein
LKPLECFFWRLQGKVFAELLQEVEELDDAAGELIVVCQAGAEFVERGSYAVEVNEILGAHVMGRGAGGVEGGRHRGTGAVDGALCEKMRCEAGFLHPGAHCVDDLGVFRFFVTDKVWALTVETPCWREAQLRLPCYQS